MPLQDHEVELVASLKHNLGFTLLLENIQAEIDIALDCIDKAPNAEAETRAVNFWRALRRVHTILVHTPEGCSQALESMQIVERNEIDNYNAAGVKFANEWGARARQLHLQMLAVDAENEVE